MNTIILTERDRRRFLAYFDEPMPSGCLIFLGGLDKTGYGRFNVGGTPELAHRVAFFLGGGEVTEDQPCVLHSCDLPCCCALGHLRRGSVAENNADMWRRARGHLPRGVVRTGSGNYGARVKVAGRQFWLGSFATASAAGAQAAAYRATIGMA